MKILAEIENVEYSLLLAPDRLPEYNISDLEKAMDADTVFILSHDNSKFAVSWWVSAKRTRSFPFARVYDTLGSSYKKVTIIPVFKDEGKDGDRDYLQWDTISLMSLLGVHVIIAYYDRAERNTLPKNINKQKITNQKFNIRHIQSQFDFLLSYHSCPLHWNLWQAKRISELIKVAVHSYRKISRLTGVELNSEETAIKRARLFEENRNAFMDLSRALAHKAQQRESKTIHKNEDINTGEKAPIIINNYLGGCYFFTADEARIDGCNLFLTEAKNSTKSNMPSLSDIKDALIMMILFTNLCSVAVDDNEYHAIPVLKMTTAKKSPLSNKKKDILTKLRKEAELNGFILEGNVYE